MAPSGTTVKISGFTGINTSEHKGVIRNSELQDALNIDIGKAGELKSRTGFIQISEGVTLGSNDTLILGHLNTGAVSQLIVKSGNNVYYSTDGITYTLLGAYSDASYGIQYDDDFYIIRSGNLIVQWNGAAAANIANSPSGTFAIIHKERMWVLNTDGSGADASRIYYSDPGDVTATGWDAAQFETVSSGDGDYLIGMAVLQDTLIIFKAHTTWALYVQGTVSDWVLRSLNTELGCVSKYAIQIVDSYLYFSSDHGIYRTDGSEFTNISENISSVLSERVINTATANLDAFAYWDDKLICLLAPDSLIKLYYVYHIKVSGWTRWEFADNIEPRNFIEIYTNSPQRGLYASDSSGEGRILRFGSEIYQDAGESFSIEVHTKQFDFDLPVEMKRGKWLGIDSFGNLILSWTHEVDSIDSTSGTVETGENRSLVKIPGPGYFRTWHLHLTATSSVEFILISLLLQVDSRRSVIKAIT